MPNSITLFKQYIDLLDEVYRLESKTSMLDISGALVQAGANANQVIVPKYSLDGLADYSRNSGYVSGDVTVTNEVVEFNYDRGRKFTVDAMDNAETAGVAFGSLAAQFIRQKVVPELDAFRFATYAGASNVLSDSAALTTGAGVIAALEAGTQAMDEEEVPESGRILFITPTLETLIHSLDTTKSREILARFDETVRVPQRRFYSAIDLADGTTSGEEAGGYSKASGAKDLNFMIITRGAVMQYTKHTVSKVFSPEENQNADGWAFVYRAYGLCDVYDNKVKGIYVSKSTS
jgi:hypothetical protein